MDIYPRYQLRPRLVGEARVYDLLAGLPVDVGFAVHSVNIPEHEYKRWGEADFVLVNRSGVTLLEVKGGTVSFTGREWRYENARGQAITSTEGPARQALSAAIALEKLLAKQVGRKIRCRWGVCFPLCSFDRELAEMPSERRADIRSCSSVESFGAWLDGIPFDQHGSEAFALDQVDIEAIREVVVPEFSAATSLGLAARAAEQETIKLTGQQFEILESLQTNPRLCISGGAGTGKTELAVLCARAELASGKRPAIVTNGAVLLSRLHQALQESRIPVVTETLPPGTDTLIVDEGQDFAQPELMRRLFSQLAGGMAAGRWRWFMDPNLQFMDKPPDPGCIAVLASSSAAVTLRHNVRSTREIVESIRAFLNADVGISRVDGFGIRVEFIEVPGADDELLAVWKALSNLLADGIEPSEIAVLGPSGMSGPTCKALAQRHPAIFRPMSLEAQTRSLSHGVICAIGEFRGLEARVVLLVDLDMLPMNIHGEALLYIGMSRASAALQLFVPPRAKDFFIHLLQTPKRQG